MMPMRRSTRDTKIINEMAAKNISIPENQNRVRHVAFDPHDLFQPGSQKDSCINTFKRK